MWQIIALLLTAIVFLLVVILGQLERIYNLLDEEYPEDDEGGMGYIPNSDPDLPPDSDELTEAWYQFITHTRASNN